MRTLTIDTRGLAFTVKVLAFVAIVCGAWYAWLPAKQYVLSIVDGSSNTAAASSPAPDKDNPARRQALERLLGGGAFSEELLDGGAEASIIEYIPAKGRFVSVDLARKQVFLYENADLVQALVLMNMPDETSVNAVQEGTYTVDTKQKAQVSTVGMVRYPYYVSFGGAFALHGEPTGARGDGINEGEALGSLELSNADAKYLYDFVSEGTPLSVREAPALVERVSTKELALADGDLPATSARAYAVIDLSSGQQYTLKNGYERYPIASVTKLITAAVSGETMGVGEQVQAPNGQYYTLGDLYYPLLLRSDNGVAHAIAAHVGTDTFISDMNAWVKSIGLYMTSFEDSSGLSPKNVSTVTDLVTLAQHLFNEKRYILDISREANMSITSTAGVRWNMHNQNKLAGDPYYRGGKLGYTDEAMQTAVSVFTVPLAGEPHAVAVVILGSHDWKQDTRTLLRWLMRNAKAEDTDSEE